MTTRSVSRNFSERERIPPDPAAKAKAAAAQLLPLRHVRTAAVESLTDSVNRSHRHRLVCLRARSRPEQEHPTTGRTAKTTQVADAETVTSAASRYQQLRPHVAELKLHAAAEALQQGTNGLKIRDVSAARKNNGPARLTALPGRSHSKPCRRRSVLQRFGRMRFRGIETTVLAPQEVSCVRSVITAESVLILLRR
jgi:hypothetical protein